MKPYELTYIISSGLTSEAADNVKKELETYLQEKGGVIVKSVKTVPQGLAYTVKKQSSGYFATLEFQGPENIIKELKARLEKDQNILRHFIIIKNPAKKMKERRMRKPLMGTPKTEISEVYTKNAKKEEVPVKSEDIDKKLEEILS